MMNVVAMSRAPPLTLRLRIAQRFYRNRFWATTPSSGYLLRRSKPELFLIGQTPSMNNPSSEAPLRDVALLPTAEEIARKVASLADEIASAMADPFTAVVILKGAFMFGADLIRALSRRGRHPRVEFIRLDSYGDALQTSGTVSLRSPPPAGIEGRPVLIVDDVLDSGLTLLAAKRLIEDCGAAEVRTCVLVRKEGKQKVPMRVDFVGFTIGDRFVVGYGIDCAENYRDLPYLGAVDRRLGRDQLEPVDVDEPAVGDLEVRDHRQGQEGELEEGLAQATAHGRTAARRKAEALPDLPERTVGQEPRDREGQLGHLARRARRRSRPRARSGG